MTLPDYQEFYRGKTVLITGGAGAIGSNLTRAVAGAGAKLVMVLDDLSSAVRWNVPGLANVMFIEGSILDEVELKRVFFEGPDLVFHLAALFANQNSIDHPETDLLVNGLGTLKLLQYAQLAGVKTLCLCLIGLLDLWQQRPPAPDRRVHVLAPEFALPDHQDAG